MPTNEAVVIDGGQIFSAYNMPTVDRFWILKEADYRTRLLPDDCRPASLVTEEA